MSLVNRQYKAGNVNADIWITQIEMDKLLYTGHGVAESLGYKILEKQLETM